MVLLISHLASFLPRINYTAAETELQFVMFEYINFRTHLNMGFDFKILPIICYSHQRLGKSILS